MGVRYETAKKTARFLGLYERFNMILLLISFVKLFTNGYQKFRKKRRALLLVSFASHMSLGAFGERLFGVFFKCPLTAVAAKVIGLAFVLVRNCARTFFDFHPADGVNVNFWLFFVHSSPP